MQFTEAAFLESVRNESNAGGILSCILFEEKDGVKKVLIGIRRARFRNYPAGEGVGVSRKEIVIGLAKALKYMASQGGTWNNVLARVQVERSL